MFRNFAKTFLKKYFNFILYILLTIKNIQLQL